MVFEEFLTREEINKTVKWLKSLQSTDGGFSDNKEQLSTLSCTYYTIRALLKLNAANKVNKNKIVSYVLSTKHSDGGFCDSPGGSFHPQYAVYAIFLLKEFNALDSINNLDSKNLINNLLILQREDGGFSGSVEDYSNIIFTYYAIRPLFLLNALHNINKSKLPEFLKSIKITNGGFSNYPQGKSSALETKHILFILDEIALIA